MIPAQTRHLLFKPYCLLHKSSMFWVKNVGRGCIQTYVLWSSLFIIVYKMLYGVTLRLLFAIILALHHLKLLRIQLSYDMFV